MFYKYWVSTSIWNISKLFWEPFWSVYYPIDIVPSWKNAVVDMLRLEGRGETDSAVRRP